MFCTHCGTRGTGKFCSECGVSLAAVEQSAAPSRTAPADWTNEFRYDVLIQILAVRDRISAAAVRSSERLSGVEFLELAEKAFAPVLGGVPLSKLAKLVQPVSAQFGIRTGKMQQRQLPLPIGTVIVEVLCALAASGQTIQQTQQLEEGCLIKAILPSDMWSFAGEFLIEITREPPGTRVTAAAKIPGQMFDWGKSQRCLDIFFERIERRNAA